MATDKEILDGEGLRDMTIEDLQEFSNVFASEFNSSDIHDRVLCFQIIENEELKYTKVDNDFINSETESENKPDPVKYEDQTLDQTVNVGVHFKETTLKNGNV